MVDSGEIGIMQVRYSNLLLMKLQQENSLLRGRVTTKAMAGAKQISPVQFLDAISTKVVSNRLNPIAATPHNYTRYWVNPIDKAVAQYVDTFDLLKTEIDPKSQLVASAASACGRDWDDEIIRAATAASTIGTDGGSLTTETFDTAAYQVSSQFGSGSTSTGLTVAKLNEAYRIFEKAHVNPRQERISLLIGSKEHFDLKNQAQVVSSDFNRNGGVLTDGYVTSFMGMDVIVSERLPTITDKDSHATCRGCLAFVASGIHMNMWQDVNTKISQADWLEGHPWQLYTKHSFGAVRGEPGRVVQIAAADTYGADVNP